MSEDRVIMNCIMPISNMSFNTNLDSVENIMREVLRVRNIKLGCYVPQFLLSFKARFQNSNEINYGSKYRSSYHNSEIFEILDEPDF